jgi:hypothetical protein
MDPYISYKTFPDASQASFDFLDSGWFKPFYLNQPFPSLEGVRACSLTNGKGRAMFTELKLFVKFGRKVSTAEGICLWAVKRHLQGQMPVPDVHGWRVDGKTCSCLWN